MKDSFKQNIVNNWMPPIVRKKIKSMFGKTKGGFFAGEYKSWEEALSNCKGYQDSDILSRVLNSTLKVKSGEVAYERDGILFDKVEYSWEVLSGIMWVAAQNQSSINVMDIGGSLGTTYFQNKAFFKNINLVSWNIIEQPNYVSAGKSNIEDEVIKFYSTVEDCLQNSSPNIVLISSSLQYMHNADIILNTLINIETEVIIFDRTIIQDSNINKIFVQYAPKSIGGSYPCYSISESWLFNKLNKNYKLLVDFESLPFPELVAINSKFKGYIFTKK